MNKKSYMSRLCDAELQLAMQSSGAVLIEGAKWCGKTSTASNVSPSVLFMQDPDNTKAYQALADTKPSLLLKGETPRLIDEWQMAPVLWDAVRFEERGPSGKAFRDDRQKLATNARIGLLFFV